jgi:bifunctional DNA-binding transcriptional regulator/antitoxin component of YhaV-PrlF toxin-antitoxin module
VKETWEAIKCFGSTTVGPRGQVVIPVGARKEMTIDSGATFLVFKALGGRGLLLLKAGAVEEMLSLVNQHLSGLEKMAADYLPAQGAGKSEGETR